MTGTQLSLLPETEADRANRVDAEILRLIMGEPAGPFGETAGDAERAVLREIRFRRGIRNAVSNRAIAERTGLDERTVKEAIRNLRLAFRLPIASSRDDKEGGYFLWMTREDLVPFKRQYLGQILRELELYKAVAGEEAALDLAKELWAGAKP